MITSYLHTECQESYEIGLINAKLNNSPYRNPFCRRIDQLESPFDWPKIKEQLTIGKSFESGVQFETLVMNCLINNLTTSEQVTPHRIQLSTSFVDYLNEAKVNLQNPLSQLHYASLLSFVDASKYKDIILKTISNVLTKYKNQSRYAPFWFMLLNVAKISPDDCSYILNLAVNNNDLVNAYTIKKLRKISYEFGNFHSLVETAEINPQLTKPEDVSEWINLLANPSNIDNVNMDTFCKILQLMQKEGYFFDTYDKSKVRKILFKKNYSQTYVILDGVKCPNCNKSLETFTMENLFDIRNKFVQRVVKGLSMYERTTPREYEYFVKYIRGNKYSSVVDALNTAHVVPVSNFTEKPNKFYSPIERNLFKVSDKKKQQQNIIQLLSALLGNLDPILVIGREFLSSWQELRSFIGKYKEKITYFNVENISYDDVFIIYAAMNSPDTFIFSNDFYRDHLAKMHDPLFQRWLQNRTVRVPMDFKIPKTFLAEAKVNFHDEYSFHLPFATPEKVSQAQWICVRKEKEI